MFVTAHPPTDFEAGEAKTLSEQQRSDPSTSQWKRREGWLSDYQGFQIGQELPGLQEGYPCYHYLKSKTNTSRGYL